HRHVGALRQQDRHAIASHNAESAKRIGETVGGVTQSAVVDLLAMPVVMEMDQRVSARIEIGPAVTNFHADVINRRHRAAEWLVKRLVVGTARQNGSAQNQISPRALQTPNRRSSEL